MLSKESASLLLELLNAQQIAVGHPDFTDTVAKLGQAKSELENLLAEEVSA